MRRRDDWCRGHQGRTVEPPLKKRKLRLVDQLEQRGVARKGEAKLGAAAAGKLDITKRANLKRIGIAYQQHHAVEFGGNRRQECEIAFKCRIRDCVRRPTAKLRQQPAQSQATRCAGVDPQRPAPTDAERIARRVENGPAFARVYQQYHVVAGQHGVHDAVGGLRSRWRRQRAVHAVLPSSVGELYGNERDEIVAAHAAFSGFANTCEALAALLWI